MSDSAVQPKRSAGLWLPLLLLSLAVLAQELLLVRLIAFPLWHHVTYMVVTTALLAFGVAGTLSAVWPALVAKTPEGARTAFSIHSLLFALTSLGIPTAIRHTELDTVQLFERPEYLVKLFALYLLVGAPLLFAGFAVTSALRHAGTLMGRTYFANLSGSGLGCILFLVGLRPLGGPGLLVLASVLAAVAAGFAARGFLRLVGGAVTIALLAVLLVPSFQSRLLPESIPVPSKEMRKYLGEGYVPEYTKWDPLCRIDVTDPPKDRADRTKLVFQDADALTFLYPKDGPEASETLVPYLMHPSLRSILVIGAGGGRELVLAARRNVPRIVGLEINSSTAELLRGPYREFTGNVVGNPAVELVEAEGRAWLGRSSENFDFIQMTGVDTYAALNSGAYVASESYLYTAGAFDAYLSHLNPGGYFSIIRLFFSDRPDRETLRLFVMATQALKRRGITNPGEHMVVVRSGAWGILVVGRDPIPPERMELVRGQLAPDRGIDLQHDPRQDLGTPFSAYAAAAKAGDEEKFYSAYPYNIRPITDDQPFFYLYHRWVSVVRQILGMSDPDAQGKGLHKTVIGHADPWLANTGQIPTGQTVLLALLVQSLVVGAFLVIGPLIAFRRRSLALPGKGRAILYFAALGLGFMLLEIALAQKFALFLGHPTYSLAIVIGGMLLFSGLGSLASERARPDRCARIAATMVAVLAVGLIVFLPRMTATWLAAPELGRIGLALLVIAPLAFLMGMPMPSGLRIVGARNPSFIPWAWAVNGVASVTASILAIVLAMAFGFTGVLGLSASLYLLAALTRPSAAA